MMVGASCVQRGGEIAQIQRGGEIAQIQRGGEIAKIQRGGEIAQIQESNGLDPRATRPSIRSEFDHTMPKSYTLSPKLDHANASVPAAVSNCSSGAQGFAFRGREVRVQPRGRDDNVQGLRV
eukprot:354306-Chlamydomonas_euryale.AAC.12